MGITNVQVGDYLHNVDTLEDYVIKEYQWTFCKDCTALGFMEWCAKSEDPSSVHYRYYVIVNVRTGKTYHVAGHKLDAAQRNGKVRHINPLNGWK